MTALPTATDHLLADLTDGVLTLTLNRPERRNAMSTEMLTALGDVLAGPATEPEVRCVVLTGAGRAFCSGGDVQDFDERGGEGGGATEVDPAAVADQLRVQNATVAALRKLPVPVIAALPGAAAGAGLGLALAADLRLGTPRTVIATAFAKVALAGDFGVAWLLDRLVGPALARELMLLSPRVDAERALALGLLNRVVPEEALAEETAALARSLARGPALAQRHIKANLLEAPFVTLEESMATEVQRHKETGLTADHVEAARAFVEKREPVFGTPTAP